MKFKELGLREEIITAVDELGFEEAMPIQEKSIPFIKNESKDLVALAQTGTGKTAAFGLPILDSIDENLRATQALVIAPTRELCVQISNDLKNFSKHIKGMKIVPVYGGENIITQLKQLDVTPQIVVATPGRLIDLMKRKKVDLSGIRYLVLDEADEMLNMGFKEDIETILESTPESRRTFLFSATMPKDVEEMSRNYMGEREQITIGTKNSGNENVEHVYYMVQAKDRYLALKRIVDMNPDIYAIIFCRTRQETQEVAEKLMKDGYNADALHGDLSQAQRDAVMQKFRIKHLQILVATDVAARGLDVSDLTHVINYNLPDDIESYTHRSGRTGRAKKKGVSIAIIHTKEKHRIKSIERIIKREFIRKDVPNGMDICKKQLFHLINRMENVEVNSEQIDPLLPEIFSKLEYLDKEEIIKKFVSLEFNRFLEYYKDARDLNVKETPKEGGNGNGSKKKKSGRKTRLKMNLGERDRITPKRLLGIINDTVGDKTISINDIEITQRYTFFDVFDDQKGKIMNAFADTDLEISEAKGSRSKGGNGNGGGERRSKKNRKDNDEPSSWRKKREKERKDRDKKRKKK
ncbi:MAG: DEAD/DEAH box helicase [Paludibacteraceae bacterium]|nr:DEAD/DEAH box helicase [Paludibacteraceae bacterium]MBQ2590308.1 DEAD/DEAH box helicase [Paludibacteraceae bacterium]